ncbi:MAG: autotransporter domain-containing protein [Alphaproteobacteria bacterium]|nr:autotransporter domain-containing protein [Alphaproteobacteria bacterium]
MLKSAIFKKTVCITTVISFTLANLPRSADAYGYRLTPESFEEMYALAQSGRVEALRSSINRGLNIDVMNSDGDTGLCVAARRHDSYTYNAFRAAGANPRHPCTQYIEDYENFISTSRAVPVTSTPRAAYSTIGKEEYSISPKIWWWVGGAALIGGGLALALGGGGGGGSKNKDESSSGGEDTEEFSSLGAIAGTKGTIHKSVSESSGENSSFMDITNSKTEEIATIKLNSNVLKNTEYLDVALKAENSGKYTNKADTIIQIGTGAVGMSAAKKAQVNNFGYINIDSSNASIGMIASETSTATNYGRGIIDNTGSQTNNGIALNFSGSEASNTLIGMYADSNSVLQNFGDIKGTAIKSVSENISQDTGGLIDPNAGQDDVKSSAATGSLVGMEAMIVNAGKDLNKNTINLLNESSGKIYLSAGDAGASQNTVKVSMIGMGSFLDDGFMNGSKNINRAENVILRNFGEINISYTGNYSPDDNLQLRKGTGGIVGMRADANTSAYNLNNINLNLEEYSSDANAYDVSAGMQSAHGGNLYNSETGNINIKTSAGNPRKNYGMISVEGDGSVSELYTDLNQNLFNSGNISIQASNSFGVASFNGGNLKNTGTIVLGKPETTTQYQKNIAMYGYGKTKEATMENTVTINIYSHDSIAMQNDFAGGTTIYNKGTINIFESATDSYVFGGAYSEAHNSKIINYYANTSGSASSKGTKDNPFSNFSISIGNSVISTSGKTILEESSATTSSTTEKIYNDKDSTINIKGSSFIAAMYVEKNENNEKTQGKAYNNGIINIDDSSYNNATNVIGMYLGQNSISNANITNNGTINTNSIFSAAMASSSTENASVINAGTISTNKEYSLGIYSKDFTNIRNTGNININSEYSIGIYTTGNTGSSTIINTSDINIGSETNFIEYSYGIYADGNSWHNITNSGNINLYTKEKGIAIYSTAPDNSDDKANYVSNRNKVNVYGDNAYGIYVENDIYVTNYEDASINIGTQEKPVSNSFGIYSNFETEDTSYVPQGEIVNKGNIKIYSSAEDSGYGIYSKSALVKNRGNIDIVNGIAVGGNNIEFINEKDCTILSTNFNAVSGVRKATNIGNIHATNGNGIYATDPENITNSGDITITSNGNGIHVIVSSVEKEVKIINNGNISVDSGYEIYVVKNYELNKKEEQEGTVKKITYTDNTTIEAGSAQVKYSGTCEPHCINGEVVYESINASTSSVSSLLLSSENKYKTITFSNDSSSLKQENLITASAFSTSGSQISNYTKTDLGFNIIPNITKQSFDAERIVNNELNEDLLTDLNENIRHKVSVMAYRNDVDGKHEVSGYKDDIISVYGYTDKRLTTNLRAGFSLSATRMESDYDDDSTRYNNMLEIGIPVIFNNNNVSALFKPKAGFARGHYRRNAVNNIYKANTKEFYYGFDSNLRQNIDIGYLSIEPNAGFNFTGLYNDDIKESNDGLKIKSKNTLSSLVSLGMDIKKKFALNNHSSLSLITGGKYFHELGDKYRSDATINNMSDYYDIVSNRFQRNFGLINFKTIYDYKQFSIEASVNLPLEQKKNIYYLFNLGYSF